MEWLSSLKISLKGYWQKTHNSSAHLNQLILNQLIQTRHYCFLHLDIPMLVDGSKDCLFSSIYVYIIFKDIFFLSVRLQQYFFKLLKYGNKLLKIYSFINVPLILFYFIFLVYFLFIFYCIISIENWSVIYSTR